MIDACRSARRTAIRHTRSGFAAACRQTAARATATPARTATAWSAPRGNATEERDLGQADHFAAEMDHFSQAILNDSDVRTPGEEGRQDRPRGVAAR